MIPSIFISSTIRDLQHLRDAVRDAVTDLAYVPILSEYGDIGFLPHLTAPDSCYAAAKDCQIAILIVGKRYGDPSEGGISVTHKEFRTIKECGIPLITLIDKETWTFKRVYDANDKNAIAAFPGMDHPDLTFALIQEITDSAANNGIIPFEHVSDARDNLKKQLAHLFGNFLRGGGSMVKADVKDILSEIITLRQELQKGQPRHDDLNLKIIRFLVEDKAKDYRQILESIFGSLEIAVGIIASRPTFEAVLEAAEYSYKIVKGRIDMKGFAESKLMIAASESMAWDVAGPEEDGGVACWALLRNKSLVLNGTALLRFNSLQRTISLISEKGKSEPDAPVNES